MERSIQQEIVQAILRGERDYAATLQDMGLVCGENNIPVRSDRISANDRQGSDFRIRRLRNPA